MRVGWVLPGKPESPRDTFAGKILTTFQNHFTVSKYVAIFHISPRAIRIQNKATINVYGYRINVIKRQLYLVTDSFCN